MRIAATFSQCSEREKSVKRGGADREGRSEVKGL